jgi:hypothetical protein
MEKLSPSEKKLRAARLRRIVRNGEELRRLLKIMRDDVYREYIYQVHGDDRWQQKRDDFWDTLEKSYGGAQEVVPHAVDRARRELKALGEPERFTREKAERSARSEDYSGLLETLDQSDDLRDVIGNL